MRWFCVMLVVSFSVAHANPRGGQGMFPMPAADFKKLVDARFVMFKSRLEENMKSHKVTDAKRDAARKQAATLQTEVMKKVDAVGADKTITKPEAMQVRKVDMQGRLAIWKELGITPPKRPGRGGGAANDDD